VPSDRDKRIDYFGNPAMFFTLEQPHQKMTVVSRSTIDVDRIEPLIDGMSPTWESTRVNLATDVTEAGLNAYQFTFDSMFAAGTPELAEYAAVSFTPQRPIFDAARDLTSRIFREFKFDPRTTTIATPLAQVFKQRSGVCQDFAHLMVACLRSLGLPARYVSGYLRTEPPPGQPRLVGADASHAWVGVYAPGFGWTDFDPTNDRVVGSDHVTIAWGRDYADVTPVKGLILGGGDHVLKVSVDIVPAGQATRPA